MEKLTLFEGTSKSIQVISISALPQLQQASEEFN